MSVPDFGDYKYFEAQLTELFNGQGRKAHQLFLCCSLLPWLVKIALKTLTILILIFLAVLLS